MVADENPDLLRCDIERVVDAIMDAILETTLSHTRLSGILESMLKATMRHEQPVQNRNFADTSGVVS